MSLPVVNNQNIPTEDEIKQIKRSTRVVTIIGALHMLNAIFLIFVGGFVLSFLALLFGSFMVSGALKKRRRLLMASLVYSVGIYILMSLAMVAYILFCPHFSIIVLLLATLFIILTGVGIRHTRQLIHFVDKFNLEGIRCCQINTHLEQLRTQTTELQQVPVQEEVAPLVTLEQQSSEQSTGAVPQFPVESSFSSQQQPPVFVTMPWPAFQPQMMPNANGQQQQMPANAQVFPMPMMYPSFYPNPYLPTQNNQQQQNQNNQH